MKAAMIYIGNFVFRFRNILFPVIIVTLYCSAMPTTELFGSVALENVKDALAWIVALTGLALRATVVGFAYIQRGGRNKKVYAEDLVIDGMFGICRNPLYVGNILVYSAFFLMHGNLFVTLSGIGLFAFMYQCIVSAEEAFLSHKFGGRYEAYCKGIPRWIPKLANFAQATNGMSFNVWRVIEKDYSTVTATFLMLILSEGYEYTVGPVVNKSVPYLLTLVAMLVLTGLVAAFVSFLKKRGALRNKVSGKETPSGAWADG